MPGSGATPHRAEWLLALCGAGATAAYFTAIWKWRSAGVEAPAFDTYQHFYANMLYLISALADGGSGLLWNPYQGAGAPFFGTNSNGITYPGNVLFLLLEPDRALLTLTVLNLTVGGVSAYALCRELGARPLAACCGAVVFQLGNASVDLTTWTPILGGAYAWLPASMLFCERTLRNPRLGNAAGLAITLSLVMLPGHLQVAFFTYQVILLRVVWEAATRRREIRTRTLSFIVVGLALPPLLIAFQLLPGIESARVGMRRSLSASDLAGTGALDWAKWRLLLTLRGALNNPLLILPSLVALDGLLHRATRRVAVFYLVTGLLYLALAFGPNTPLFPLYASLPLSRLFRGPVRFLWITSFCLAPLVALGMEALSRHAERGPRPAGAGAALMPGAILLGLSQLTLRGLHRPEWILGALATAAALFSALVARWRTVFLWVVASVVVGYTLAFPVHTPTGALLIPGLRAVFGRSLLPNGSVMLTHADVFAALRATMTARDRAYFVNGHLSFAFPPKAASLFHVPSIQNYEPQPTERFAKYLVMMRTGRPMRRVDDFYISLSGQMPISLRRPLFDLSASRYIVADPEVDSTHRSLHPPPRLLFERNGLRVYENEQALPRAFYVPRVAVVGEPERLLRRLALGIDDVRTVALVERMPSSGFNGVAPYDGEGTVDFVTDEPEQIVLEVQASERGFLFLSDQHFPGWQATVNGDPVPIERANYLFRLVEVPAGRCRVEFLYRPASVWIGAVVSAVAVIGLIAVGRRRRWR